MDTVARVHWGTGNRGVVVSKTRRVMLMAAALGATLSLVAVGCGNSDSSGSSTTEKSNGSDTTNSSGSVVSITGVPGVTDTEIRVGGVASTTNPLGGTQGSAFDGAQAYFDKVNDEEGGVHGRKIVLVSKRDDKLSSNADEVKGLLEQDNVFAVVPVAVLLFTGADQLVEQNVPTFGWNINDEWGGTAEQPRLNMFGQAGSYLGIGTATKNTPYLVNKAGRHKVGLLAYNVPQSAGCLDGYVASFDKYGDEADASVVFKDASLSFGTTDLSVQVQKMKEAGVDVVATCMDNNGVVTVAKELKKQNLDAIQLLPNSYDQSTMDEFGDLFEGSYAYISETPLEADPEPDAMAEFKAAMEKADTAINENSYVGWINATQFVQGLKDAGPQFDRQKVIDAINKQTDYKADGLVAGIDWTTAHTEPGPDNCFALLEIKDSKFVPQTEEKGKYFTCIENAGMSLEPTFK